MALAQRQRYSDDDYSKGDKLDQRIGLFPRGISMTEETRGATAQRVDSYHVYITPFINEMTIVRQENGQLF